MTGLVLAVALMCTVLSVMNGFDTEMRSRILAVVPHLAVMEADGLSIDSPLIETLAQDPRVADVSKFIELQGLIERGGKVSAFLGVGVEAPEAWLLPEMIEARSSSGILVGRLLAMDLGLEIGGSVNLIVPGKSRQTAKVQAFEVAGFIETATEVDNSLVLLPLDRAAHFLNFGSARVSGIRAQLKDVFEASSLAQELRFTLEPTQYVRHWGMTHGNLYAAIQLSRDLIVILVAAVVFIAAFNVISSLVLLVTDKQKEIAMLATMGAEPGHIISIFLYLGALIGLIGSLVGGFLGALLAFNITAMVSFVEQALDVQFLNTDVYPIAFLPSDPSLGDFILVVLVGLIACILAAIYPAIRAARLQPATVLTEV